MANLNAMSDDLRAIVAGVRQGKGTLGALLVDPTVYEDIKSAVGNVERNEVLRALVRYSIKADEEKKPVDAGASQPKNRPTAELRHQFAPVLVAARPGSGWATSARSSPWRITREPQQVDLSAAKKPCAETPPSRLHTCAPDGELQAPTARRA